MILNRCYLILDIVKGWRRMKETTEEADEEKEEGNNIHNYKTEKRREAITGKAWKNEVREWGGSTRRKDEEEMMQQ